MWDSYHLDDLAAEPGNDLVDLGELQNRVVSEVVHHSTLLNSWQLLKDWVPWAASYIDDDSERKLERGKLFLQILSENGVQANIHWFPSRVS